jgi:putative DNA primase/helicase
MSAAHIVEALGGHRAGREWMARCPAHDDRTPSLAIREGRDGKILLKCHAGCSQWDVIDALKNSGIWTPGKTRPQERVLISSPRLQNESDAQRATFALKLWDESADARGTGVATYLSSRGLSLPATNCLRFHPGLKHPSGLRWPAMVALVLGTDAEPIAVHRTFLAKDGACKAPVSPQKMMLGRAKGGAVHLSPAASTLMVGEGIETTLSAMQAAGLPGWAALSTSGMKSLRLPEKVREVIILTDRDAAGEAAAEASAARWVQEGRSVRIARPSEGSNDFNDMLCRSS